MKPSDFIYILDEGHGKFPKINYSGQNSNNLEYAPVGRTGIILQVLFKNICLKENRMDKCIGAKDFIFD
jgi:hypothetical protein